MKTWAVPALIVVVVLGISLALIAQEIVIPLPAGPLGAGYVIGSVLREMDLSGIDYSKIAVAVENDKVLLTLTEQLPAGTRVSTFQTELQQHALERYTKMIETLEEWKMSQETVKVDEDWNPVDESGRAIIDDQGATAPPTGKVLTITFEDFGKQLQAVKSCQSALTTEKTTLQKKQAAKTLSGAVELLQNMDNAYRLAQEVKNARITETFTEWQKRQDVVVKLDEAGHPVNEAGEAIIDADGTTAAPTGKVSSITFGDFEKQLQAVKSCQQSLALASNGRQKKQDIHALAKTVTLLQNMDDAFWLAQEAKNVHIIETLGDWGKTPDAEVDLATTAGGEVIGVFERNGNYCAINVDGTLGDAVTGARVNTYKFVDAAAIRDQLEEQKRQYAATKSTTLGDQIAESSILLERLCESFLLTRQAKANITIQAKQVLYMQLSVLGLVMLVVVGILLSE